MSLVEAISISTEAFVLGHQCVSAQTSPQELCSRTNVATGLVYVEYGDVENLGNRTLGQSVNGSDQEFAYIGQNYIHCPTGLRIKVETGLGHEMWNDELANNEYDDAVSTLKRRIETIRTKRTNSTLDIANELRESNLATFFCVELNSLEKPEWGNTAHSVCNEFYPGTIGYWWPFPGGELGNPPKIESIHELSEMYNRLNSANEGRLQ